MKKFDPRELKKLYVPPTGSSGEDNGQVTIIGGSDLFHGAPLLALSIASRIVDMVFFSSPAPSVGKVAENIKSKLFSFIWVPFEEIEKYIEKSDAVLIGPGMKRYISEKFKVQTVKLDKDGKETKRITKELLQKFPDKRWVIDAGSLQTMEADWIPKNAIITPNYKEFEILFGQEIKDRNDVGYIGDIVQFQAQAHKCIIVLKGPSTIVSDGKETIQVKGGNPGLTKGGTGDVLAGLTVALLAKNEPMLAACSASYLIKKAADELYEEVGTNYNADDVGHYVPRLLRSFL